MYACESQRAGLWQQQATGAVIITEVGGKTSQPHVLQVLLNITDQLSTILRSSRSHREINHVRMRLNWLKDARVKHLKVPQVTLDWRTIENIKTFSATLPTNLTGNCLFPPVTRASTHQDALAHKHIIIRNPPYGQCEQKGNTHTHTVRAALPSPLPAGPQLCPSLIKTQGTGSRKTRQVFISAPHLLPSSLLLLSVNNLSLYTQAAF